MSLEWGKEKIKGSRHLVKKTEGPNDWAWWALFGVIMIMVILVILKMLGKI